ncbi:MAG: ATP-binding protein [Bacteroidota bacterium]
MDTTLKILHIEDSSADAELVAYQLRQAKLSCTIQVVDTEDEFSRGLQEFAPEVILSDHSLPRFDSLAALDLFRKSGMRIPFILVTGAVSEEFAVKCLKAGADDYILKTNLTRLPTAIRQALKEKQTEIERDEAIKKLNYKIQELDTFMYKASHDLKGPLASMAGLIEMVKEEVRDKKMQEYIGMIEQSNRKLERILYDLIEVTKIAQGRPVIAPIELKKLIEETIHSLKNLEQAKEVIFFTSIQVPAPVASDRNLLATIIQNLIHNAIIYRREGLDAYVSVNAYERDGRILIEVEDNGIGIASEIRSKIFDMFYRGNYSSKGSGLGLYIVKQAVEKLGGTIDVKNNLSQGSRFTVSLPSSYKI